jgi:hypothetical protein
MMGLGLRVWVGAAIALCLVVGSGCGEEGDASKEETDVNKVELGAGGECNPPGSTDLLETEVLTVEASSGDTHVDFFNPGLSGLHGTVLQANAVNDYVVYQPDCFAQTGNRRVRVRGFRTPVSGRFQLGWSASSSGPWNNVGAVQDLYASATGFLEFDLGVVNLSSSSPYFRFLVTGKNISSSSYILHLDYVKLTPP